VTARAVVIGLGILLLFIPAAFYTEIAWLRVYQFASGVPATMPIFTLFALAAAMGIPGLRRVGLTRRELLAVFSIVLVGSPLVSHGVLFWMIPKVIAYYYAAQIHPLWATTFLPLVPAWFAPSTPAAVNGFFEGQAAVPWSQWWLPLGAWSSFLVCLFVATLCAMSLLQRQWITNERLAFPIAQIPLEMVAQPEGGEGRANRLPIVWMFWIGVLMSLALTFLSTLSSKLPAIPSIPLGPVPLMQWRKVGPLAGLGEIDLVLWPGMIAIAFLIPKELSFSAWFFWLVRLGLTVIAIAAGQAPRLPEDWYESTFPAPYYQGGGAALALFVWVLWIARHHLRRALRTTFGRRSTAAEVDEPLPYRWAVIGLALSFAWLVAFCWLAGCRLIFAVGLVALIIGYYIMWARIRAETGLGFIPFPLEIQNGLTSLLGTSSLRPREIVTLISTRWAYFPGFGESSEVITGNTLESFKIADAARINARRLTAALVAGFLVALAGGAIVVLKGIYHYGYFNLAMGGAYGWPSWQTRNDGERIFTFLQNPTGPDAGAIAAVAAGAAVAAILGIMRLRFWWWPFHPIGYIAANCWGMHWYYMPFLVGWAWKTLVIRYGGLRLYRAMVPLAIGLIVGDQLNGGIWVIVALVTKGRV